MVCMLKINPNSNSYESRANIYKIAGIATAWCAEPYINDALGKMFYKTLATLNLNDKGGDFIPYIQKTMEQYNLKDKLILYDLNEKTVNELRKELKIDAPEKKIPTFVRKILRLPDNRKKESFKQTLEGKNAIFIPYKNMIICNLEKMGSAVFHELGHNLNAQSKNLFMRILRVLKGPSVYYAPILISATALAIDPKEKKEPNRNIGDFIKSNCGLLATLSVLPFTIEECIASIKGQQMAKKAGVTGELLKKVTNSHKISAMNYISKAIFTGISVYLASKLRDVIATKKTSNKIS